MSDIAKFPEGPWLFEPNGAFRGNICGEEWPLGYISAGPGKPVFALHEVAGEYSVADLTAAARKAAAAPELYEALVAMKKELWMTSRHQWTVADFKRWAIIQQVDAALQKADGMQRTEEHS